VYAPYIWAQLGIELIVEYLSLQYLRVTKECAACSVALHSMDSCLVRSYKGKVTYTLIKEREREREK